MFYWKTMYSLDFGYSIITSFHWGTYGLVTWMFESFGFVGNWFDICWLSWLPEGDGVGGGFCFVVKFEFSSFLTSIGVSVAVFVGIQVFIYTRVQT